MLFKGFSVHPVIPYSYRSKTYIKVPSRGVWKVCKGLTTLASSLYYSALSLSASISLRFEAVEAAAAAAALLPHSP